jgi:hypothetical protein
LFYSFSLFILLVLFLSYFYFIPFIYLKKTKYRKSFEKAFKSQEKIKRTPLFKSNSFSSSPDAQQLINEINLEREKELEEEIEQSQKLIDELEEIPDIKPNIQKEVKKEDIQQKKEVIPFISEDDINIKRCPICKSKTKRYKVIKMENSLRQHIKCKKCDWEKEIIEIL